MDPDAGALDLDAGIPTPGSRCGDLNTGIPLRGSMRGSRRGDPEAGPRCGELDAGISLRGSRGRGPEAGISRRGSRGGDLDRGDLEAGISRRGSRCGDLDAGSRCGISMRDLDAGISMRGSRCRIAMRMILMRSLWTGRTGSPRCSPRCGARFPMLLARVPEAFGKAPSSFSAPLRGEPARSTDRTSGKGSGSSAPLRGELASTFNLLWRRRSEPGAASRPSRHRAVPALAPFRA
jgi:hypothetical protein